MAEILYVQTDKNMKVTKEQILLGEIAKLSSADPKITARNQNREITSLPRGQYGRYVLSATDLIRVIEKNERDVVVSHIGEPTFVITYVDVDKTNKIIGWLKTALVCLVTFFGAAFSIMTFHNDVDIGKLFADIYRMFTGKESDGCTILEIMYSIGIGLGVIFYFNHFGRRKLTQDPTPMEVQMRLYEDDVDATIIEREERGGGSCGCSS